MSSVRLDITADLTALQKQALARDMGEVVSRVAGIDVCKVTVSVLVHPLGSLWQCQAWEPVPATLLTCAIAGARDHAVRKELADSLTAIIATRTQLPREAIAVEFGQADLPTRRPRQWTKHSPSVRRVGSGPSRGSAWEAFVANTIGRLSTALRLSRSSSAPVTTDATASVESHPMTPGHTITTGPWEGLHLKRKQWELYSPEIEINPS